VLVCTVYV